MKISIKLVYMLIFFTFFTHLNHLHPLQVENYDSNSRLVVDENDNVKSGLKWLICFSSRLIPVDWNEICGSILANIWSEIKHVNNFKKLWIAVKVGG